MISFEQLRKKAEDPIATFERLFRAALKSLLPDLAACPWYVREREVVNLFVFQHLIPRFQKKKLDISQLGIEVPVLKRPKANCDKPEEVEIGQVGMGTPALKPEKRPREAVGRYADIVVWPHSKATRWRTCRPLAHIEWKNISCLEKHPEMLKRQHDRDICLLMHSRELVCVSYAVLTDQRNKHVELRCTRIVDGKEPEDFFSPSSSLRCETTYLGKILTYDELRGVKQGSGCPNKGCNPEWLRKSRVHSV
jgi:hypothetical protein